MPDDMQEHILGSLTLRELDRVATTCRNFHHSFQRRLAQHKDRCDLAVFEWFGHKRIIGIADIVNDFLKGEGFVLTLPVDRTCACQLSSDGLLRIQDPVMTPSQAPSEPAFEAGGIIVRVITTCHNPPSPSHLWLVVRTPGLESVAVLVVRQGKFVFITVTDKKCAPYSEGEALVQALLSGGFGPQHGEWLHANVWSGVGICKH